MNDVITRKKELLTTLKKNVALVENELKELKDVEPTKFSERELNFSKDADKALFGKFKNVKYISKKDDIYSIITKRFEKIKIQEIKLQEKILLYEQFFAEIENENRH